MLCHPSSVGSLLRLAVLTPHRLALRCLRSARPKYYAREVHKLTWHRSSHRSRDKFSTGAPLNHRQMLAGIHKPPDVQFNAVFFD